MKVRRLNTNSIVHNRGASNHRHSLNPSVKPVRYGDNPVGGFQGSYGKEGTDAYFGPAPTESTPSINTNTQVGGFQGSYGKEGTDAYFGTAPTTPSITTNSSSTPSQSTNNNNDGSNAEAEMENRKGHAREHAAQGIIDALHYLPTPGIIGQVVQGALGGGNTIGAGLDSALNGTRYDPAESIGGTALNAAAAGLGELGSAAGTRSSSSSASRASTASRSSTASRPSTASNTTSNPFTSTRSSTLSDTTYNPSTSARSSRASLGNNDIQMESMGSTGSVTGNNAAIYDAAPAYSSPKNGQLPAYSGKGTDASIGPEYITKANEAFGSGKGTSASVGPEYITKANEAFGSTNKKKTIHTQFGLNEEFFKRLAQAEKHYKIKHTYKKGVCRM